MWLGWFGCVERCPIDVDGRCVRVEAVGRSDDGDPAGGDPFGGPSGGSSESTGDDDGSTGSPARVELAASPLAGALDCPVAAELVVRNRGAAAVVVESVAADGVDVDVPLPVRVAAGEGLTLQLAVTASAPIARELVFEVSGDGWTEALAVPAAFEAAAFTETFAFTPAAVDWVLALDVGDGAYAESAPWYDGLTAVADAMTAANLDWRVLVVDRWDGCQWWFDHDAPYDVIDEALDDWWLAGLLFYSVEADQELIALSITSVELSVDGVCNVAFRRPDAELLVTALTDEPEASGVAWGDHLAALQAFGAVTVSGAFDLADGCGDPGADDGYAPLVAATGGGSVDLCDPGWSADADALGPAALRPPAYVLAATPDPGSVEVRVDGARVGASVDGDTVTLDALPTVAADVEVTYTAPGCPVR